MIATTQCSNVLIVEDHQSVQENLVNRLQQQYPEAKLATACTAEQALQKLTEQLPDVMMMDLAVPAQIGDEPEQDHGIQLLRTILENYPELNIVVWSSKVETLVRIKPLIDSHQGGFSVAPKALPMDTILMRVNLSLQKATYVHHELRSSLEVKPEWLDMLQLAFQQGLQDKAIAERMNIAERTVRHYWKKVQDVLGVYPEEGINMRIQTGIRAREEGLID